MAENEQDNELENMTPSRADSAAAHTSSEPFDTPATSTSAPTDPSSGGDPATAWSSSPPFAGYPSGSAHPRSARIRRALGSRVAGWAVALGMSGAVIGLSIALATSGTPTAARPPTGSFTAPNGGGVRDGFGRGTSGTVDSVSGTIFTMTTSSGARVTVHEQSSTVYRGGNGTTSSSSIASGHRVVVVGSTSGSTITATQIFVIRAGFAGA